MKINQSINSIRWPPLNMKTPQLSLLTIQMGLLNFMFYANQPWSSVQVTFPLVFFYHTGRLYYVKCDNVYLRFQVLPYKHTFTISAVKVFSLFCFASKTKLTRDYQNLLLQQIVTEACLFSSLSSKVLEDLKVGESLCEYFFGINKLER